MRRNRLAARPPARRSGRSGAFALVAAAALFGPAAPGRAQCGGHDGARWMAHQSLVLLLNPMGAEHNARLGLCLPLYGSSEPALALNHVEIGVSTYLSPVYLVGGGYVQVAPASFLFVRVEASGLGIWPLPLDGAGFFERTGYGQRWGRSDLPHARAGSAAGWTVRVMAVLRGSVELAPRLALVGFDALWLDHTRVDGGAHGVGTRGAGTHWVDVRHDVIAARAEWVFANEGALLLAAQVPGGPELRFGVFSALRHVPAAGYVGHRLGPIVMLGLSDPDPAVHALDLFVRLSVYTHHRFRTIEAATMAGLSVDWDLGAL